MILRSRRKLANFMTLETARKIVAVGLAFWFVFLSAAINGLHGHDGGSCGTCGRQFCTIEPYSGASKSGSPRVDDLLEPADAPRSDFQLYPACAFLKVDLERCVRRITLETENTKSKSYDLEKIVSTSRFNSRTASPRAPPLSLTS